MQCARCGCEVAAHLHRCTSCGAELAAVTAAGGATSVSIEAMVTGATFQAVGVQTGTEVPVLTGARHDAGPASAPAGRPRRTWSDATTGPLAIGQTFGRYHIIRLLGSGGMGFVYQAWDEQLEVAVAIKVMRKRGNDPAEAELIEKRFKRELVLARQVTHRNVVRIHDLGEIDGIKYITMPFVEGEDLLEVWRRDGKLPAARVLRLARGIASGLVAAHTAGVVHRDLKPANVMVDAQGEALIMDFGIARSTDGVAATGATAPASQLSSDALQTVAPAATMAGAIVGTLEYMAPEQAQGKPVDQRADIYAFGLILYDLLLGGRITTSRTSAIDELKARLDQAPPTPRFVDQSIPESLDRIITRCLQPDAAHRYQTSRELLAELDQLDDDGVPIPVPRTLGKRTIAAAVALMIVLVGGTWWVVRPRPIPQQPPPMSVLIADFENTTGDTAFDGALEEAMGIALEGASFINAYPRRDAQRVGAEIRPGARLDAELARLISVREGIKTLVSGAVVRTGSAYKVTVRAIDPSTSNVLASNEKTAATKEAVLGAVGSIAADIRRVLGDTAPARDRLAAAETFTTSSLEAVRNYSMAQNLAANGRYDESIDYYRKATDQDAKFGRAFAGWATSAYKTGHEEEAESLYKRAFAVMDRMTEREKYRTLGGYYVGVARNYDKAIENFEALVRLYPADGAGHNNLALAYFSTLNFQKALEEGRRVLDLYPNLLLYRSNFALYAMYAGDFTTAAEEAARVVDQNASFSVAYLPLAIGALDAGDFDGARSAYERMRASSPGGASRASLGLADLAMYRGQFKEAVSILDNGIREDEKAGNKLAMAIKYAAQAEAHQAMGAQNLAIASASLALKLSHQESAAVTAARVLIRARRPADAEAIASELANRFQPQSRAYGELLRAEIAASEGRAVEAADAINRAQKLSDGWLARLVLGTIFTTAGQTPEAISELELAGKRSGEASALFLDDLPTFRYRALHLYWLARAQEGVGLADAAATTRQRLHDIAPTTPIQPTAASPWLRLSVAAPR